MQYCSHQGCLHNFSRFSYSLLNLKALNFVCNMSVFGVVNSKSTFSEAREILSEDIKRSMACRVEIIEDQVEDCSSEDKENIQNLFSSFELARRVNYDFGIVPISLYEG